MKIFNYKKNNITLLYTNSTFDTNLLCNVNKVNPLGAIIAGRVSSSLVLLDNFIRLKKIIDKNSTLGLEIYGYHGCKKLVMKINANGEMFYDSDSLYSLFKNTEDSSSMNVSNFMCGDNKSNLLIHLFEESNGKVENLVQRYNNCNYLTSNSGNISDEFSLILKMFGFSRSALSIGVDFNFNTFNVISSGAYWYIIEDDNFNASFLGEHIKTLPQIKDLLPKNNYNDINIIDEIIGDFNLDFVNLDYYAFNFNAFSKKIYDKSLLPRVIKGLKLDTKNDYIKLEKADYNPNLKDFAFNVHNCDNTLLEYRDLKIPVIGIFNIGDNVKSVLFNLNIELSDKSEIVNDCDNEFRESFINILSLFSDVNVKIWVDNMDVTLTGSSMSASIYYGIFCLLNNLEIDSNRVFSANIDKYGNTHFISSVIFKLRCAISYGIQRFYLPFENKKEIESKLCDFEKDLIDIKYFGNIKKELSK